MTGTLFDLPKTDRPTRPSHLYAESTGNTPTLCGIKRYTDASYPCMLARYADHHRYEYRRCRTCYEAAGLASMLTVEDN